jgi:hypothetical protein
MIALGGQTFDGGDLLADRVADRGLAGANGFAVDVNRASAAKTCAATEFRPGHLQLLADDPKQRRIVGRLDGHIPSIDIEIRHWRFPLPVLGAAYGGISLLGIGRHPPGRCQSARRMIPNFPGGNPIWNRSKRIKFFWDGRCALRQGFVIDTSIDLVAADASSVYAFPNRERIALG